MDGREYFMESIYLKRRNQISIKYLPVLHLIFHYHLSFQVQPPVYLEKWQHLPTHLILVRIVHQFLVIVEVDQMLVHYTAEIHLSLVMVVVGRML